MPTTTTIFGPHFFYNIKLLLNNDHLSITATNLEFQGWSLNTGLTALNFFRLKLFTSEVDQVSAEPKLKTVILKLHSYIPLLCNTFFRSWSQYCKTQNSSKMKSAIITLLMDCFNFHHSSDEVMQGRILRPNSFNGDKICFYRIGSRWFIDCFYHHLQILSIIRKRNYRNRMLLSIIMIKKRNKNKSLSIQSIFYT